MFSNPPSDRRPLRAARRWLAGRSLRTRLVFALLALLAVVSVAIGGLTTVALRHFLIERLDAQLAPATTMRGDRPGWPAFPGNGPGVPPGSPPGTVVAVITDGRVTSARTLTADPSADDRFPDEQAVPVGEVAALAALPVDAEPRTVDLGARGDYRAVARQYWDGRVRVVAIPLSGVQETVWWMVAAQAAVAAAGLLVAGAAGALIVRATLRPLNRVAATATRVTELPLDRGEVALAVRVPDADTDPRTEVGQVGAALNRMLGHVADALSARQASETRVRQFVADASHELRTPLAAIRGYAEVARRGRDEVPPDVAHALRRVESESTRMTRLVDDLLLLARLDAGRPLAVEPVDLTALVVDAVSDAHVAGPDHRWQLDLPEVAVRVPGDAARLHQVVANLLANARVHTPPGSTVTTTLAVDAGYAVLTVADDGPGVPAELQPEMFERFARGDSSRSRAHGSTGLGLAIVAAVVEAHRGTVGVDSRPGRTAFTVRLPNPTADA
ncbi:HAMP domain-containing sensor histidine kinase [Micromonospora sp. WMMD964]|uniref:sensor histidine kinase n=1 Tax=Micromonospora sp. WMMD964 TaxID=3016091 RepID=UPI00249AA427|nr:HAMP domain-containing sensor histidine kinase [Micromonospora sp. WMMD964]WFE99077.1 HAMP domain-containing sensor histidine kinase [Micromonospora sp. WMMD964]